MGKESEFSMTYKTKDQGFTIIELLIVIVVIGILVFLIFSTLSGVKQKERNTERQTDIKALQAAVESYYAQNSRYPTLANMNDSAFRTANLKTLEDDNLKDPQGAEAKLVDKPAAQVYSYAVFASDRSTPCDNSKKDCVTYTLTATTEGGGKFEKTNLN